MREILIGGYKNISELLNKIWEVMLKRKSYPAKQKRVPLNSKHSGERMIHLLYTSIA